MNDLGIIKKLLVFIVDNVFIKEECDELIRMIEERKYIDVMLNDGYGG